MMRQPWPQRLTYEQQIVELRKANRNLAWLCYLLVGLVAGLCFLFAWTH